MLLLFGLRLKIWCKCLSESTNHIWNQVSVSCTLSKTKQLQRSEKIIPSQIRVKNSFANSNWTFFQKFPSQIHFEKDGFTPPNSTKNLMPINIDHMWKQASLCRTTWRVIFCACCSFANSHRKNMILHFPTQLNNWCTSVRAHQHYSHKPFTITKQLNLSPTTLKTMNFSENDFFATNPCQKRWFAHQTSTQHLIQMLQRF